MIFELKKIFGFLAKKKTTVLWLSVVFFFVSSPAEISAQKKFSKSYPASKNVRLLLKNRTGTVTVEGWDKPEVKISAFIENSNTIIAPENLSGTIQINLIKDNQGKNEVGSVNFIVKVPHFSSVNIETMMGNLNVTNVRGGFVRAHIATDGDITLTNISAENVAAENMTGDIFFDGELHSGGIYRFSTTSGNINLHIPSNSSFRLTATAPSTRNISLGAFAGANMNFISNGRRVIGKVGDGSATMTVTSQRKSISFIRR
jgi:DUF4097 and DUF4098 domain-containing protein YvlB